MGAARRAFAASARAAGRDAIAGARRRSRRWWTRAIGDPTTSPRASRRRDEPPGRDDARPPRSRRRSRARSSRTRATSRNSCPTRTFRTSRRTGPRGSVWRAREPRRRPPPRPLSAGFRAATWQRKPRCGRSAMDAQSQKWSPSSSTRGSRSRGCARSARIVSRAEIEIWGKSSARAIISTISRCTPPPRRARSRRGGARGRRRASPRLVRYPRRSPAARCGAPDRPRPPPTVPTPVPAGCERRAPRRRVVERPPSRPRARGARSPRPRPPSPRHSQRRRPTSRTTGANLPSWSARDPPARSPRSTSRTSVGGYASSSDAPRDPTPPGTRGLRRRREQGRGRTSPSVPPIEATTWC